MTQYIAMVKLTGEGRIDVIASIESFQRSVRRRPLLANVELLEHTLPKTRFVVELNGKRILVDFNHEGTIRVWHLVKVNPDIKIHPDTDISTLGEGMFSCPDTHGAVMFVTSMLGHAAS